MLCIHPPSPIPPIPTHPTPPQILAHMLFNEFAIISSSAFQPQTNLATNIQILLGICSQRVL